MGDTKMNKKIKRIVAFTLVISSFSIIEPIKHITLTNAVEANAAVVGAELEKISLGRGSIDFKHSKTEYSLTLNSSVEELEVRATPKESDAKVEINGNEVYESSNYESVVNLDKGENTIIIKVQNGTKKKTYTLTVIRGKIEEEKQIYLSDISLSTGDLDFSKEVTSYNIDVEQNVKEISIKAKPEDTKYDVEIDRVTANDDNNYKKTVSLDNGNNVIKIRIQDDDDHEKVYTLNINRGGASTTTNTSANASNNGTKTNTTETNSTTNAINPTQTTGVSNSNISTTKGWTLNNGDWYYIDEKGNKQTSWKSVDGKWYYLDQNGVMKKGWQFINSNWYFLDINGAMRTGWLKNQDGKWYYLYNSGVMAKSTIIDGFKIDSTGAWIK